MFIQPDWFEVTTPSVGTNRYAYSLNDPINLSDPGGNCPQCPILAGAILLEMLGLTVGAGIAVTIVAPNMDLPNHTVSPPIDLELPIATGGAVDIGLLGVLVTAMRVADPIVPNIFWTPQAESLPQVVSTPPAEQLVPNHVANSRMRDSLGLRPHDGWIGHHNIPIQHRGHAVVQAGIRAGIDFYGAIHGTSVRSQPGGHPQYNNRILERLEELAERGLTDEGYRAALEGISEQERDRIENEWDGHVRNE